tara:strand:+ start:893 stop:1639 length:747 start_codon:yes stop_codon:yes gene_type:complete
VLQRARSHAVSPLLLTGTDLDSSAAAIGLCAVHSDLFCTAGIHPHDAAGAPDDWADRLRTLAANPAVRAIGETGLDFNRNYSPPEAQRALFAGQIVLAGDLGKPLFVHDRDTGGAVYEMLAERSPTVPDVVVHCFTGNRVDLERYLEAGYYIGITGWVCDPSRGDELRSLVPDIPIDRLLVETDAPFLFPAGASAPAAGRKHRNEPCLLPYVINEIARLRNVHSDAIAAATTSNARALFSLPVSDVNT